MLQPLRIVPDMVFPALRLSRSRKLRRPLGNAVQRPVLVDVIFDSLGPRVGKNDFELVLVAVGSEPRLFNVLTVRRMVWIEPLRWVWCQHNHLAAGADVQCKQN